VRWPITLIVVLVDETGLQRFEPAAYDEYADRR
jgi:hypothetical protein